MASSLQKHAPLAPYAPMKARICVRVSRREAIYRVFCKWQTSVLLMTTRVWLNRPFQCAFFPRVITSASTLLERISKSMYVLKVRTQRERSRFNILIIFASTRFMLASALRWRYCLWFFFMFSIQWKLVSCSRHNVAYYFARETTDNVLLFCLAPYNA